MLLNKVLLKFTSVWFNSVFGESRVVYGMAVSYTHLDVYKRQLQRLELNYNL